MALTAAVSVVVGVSALAGGSPGAKNPPPSTPAPAPALPPGATPPQEANLSPSVGQPAFDVNGVPIYLPDGANLTDYGAVTDFGGGQPPPIVELRLGESRVRFDKVRGTLLESDVKPVDQAALLPLIDALDKPIANDAEGALRIFSPYFSTLALPQSVNYAETTAGDANSLFEPTRDWGLPPDAPVWAIVGRGKSIEGGQRPYTPTVWVVVAKGSEASILVGTDDRVPFGGIDLAALGVPVSVPVDGIPKP